MEVGEGMINLPPFNLLFMDEDKGHVQWLGLTLYFVDFVVMDFEDESRDHTSSACEKKSTVL